MSIPIVIVCELIIMGLAILCLYCNSMKFANLLLKGLFGFNCVYFGLIMAIGLIP